MLEVHTEQLLVAARHIAVAAEALTAAAATPPAHPPVATDEISTSAAARLTEHGVVLASRASDGAAVLTAAAVAITQAAGAFAQMDRNNAQTVSLRGIPGAPAVTFTPAATVNAPDPSLPIAAPLPRDGRITAAVVESGTLQPDQVSSPAAPRTPPRSAQPHRSCAPPRSPSRAR